MKKLLLTSVIFFFSLTNLLSQNVQVTERLSGKLKSLNPIEYTRVLILLKDRIDIEALDKKLYDINAPINYRAELVINTLRQKAEQTQGPILEYLKLERETGKVKQYINFWITNLIFIEATSDVLNELTKRNDIDVMDLDAELDMDRPYPSNNESVENGLRVIKADSLWKIGITGAGRTVMNIDGGVNGTHPALSPRWWGNNGRQWYHSWFDPIAPSSSAPFDCAAGGVWHGTHTMGIMCGRNTATGDTVGVAPDAYWMAAGVTDCPGASYPSMNIAAYQWAMDPDTNAATMNMPDVINCSWRDPTATDECTSSIYRTTLTAVEAAGIAVVFSAGNSGPSASTITPPKNINIDSVNVFCVGSINGTSLVVSGSSSRGPSLCGGSGTLLIKPEVCAPGEGIRSSWSGTSYSSISGTSMASPHVSGCIALLKQAAPGMTGRQLKAILFSTTTDLGAAGEDNNYGKGLINVNKAYMMLGPVIQHTVLSNTENLAGPYTVNCNILPSSSGIDPSKTKLFWSRNNPSVTDSLLMTNSSGNNWTANIPGNGSPATYRYYIKTTDSSGKSSTAPIGAPGTLYSFLAEQDTQDPVITHTLLDDQAKPNWPVSVAATVTDNIGIDSVWVVWYKNVVANTKQFRLNNGGGNNFSALFNSLNSDVNIGDRIFYKIFAQDNSTSRNRDSTALFDFDIIDVELCEGFISATYPPTNWNVEFTGTNYWTRNAVSSYGVGSGSSKFDFWTASSGTIQSLVTLTFSSSVAGDSLEFDHAYAPYTTGVDSLVIQTSSNGGSTYTQLVRLWGSAAVGPLNTAPTSTSQFTPTNAQWATKRYALPVGTNKVKLRARSGFGNNLYVDEVCVVNNAAPVASTIILAQQGYYNTISNTLSLSDTVSVYLRNISSPYNIVDSGKTVIDMASLSGSVLFGNAATGTYYLQVRHRNTIETWSKSGGESYTRGLPFNYNFTTAQSQAFGNNMILKGSKYCIYSGDADQDGVVDGTDASMVSNDAENFVIGYVVTDLDGSLFVDGSDYSIADNNAFNFVTKSTPETTPLTTKARIRNNDSINKVKIIRKENATVPEIKNEQESSFKIKNDLKKTKK